MVGPEHWIERGQSKRTRLRDSLRSVQLLVRVPVETVAGCVTEAAVAAVEVAAVAVTVASRPPTGPTRCSATPNWPHPNWANPMYWQAHGVAPTAAANALAVVVERHKAEHQRL